MASVFELMASQEPEIIDTSKRNSTVSPFQLLAQEETQEPVPKSALRTALQVPQGILSTTPPGIAAGLWSLLSSGEIYDPEEIDRLKEISKREGVPFDEEAYLEAGRQALGTIPTVSNIAGAIESKTGVPLEPKTRLQKGTRFLTEATRLAPSGTTFRGLDTTLPKPVLGAGVTATKELLQEAGLPESISELASFGILKQTPKGGGEISVGAKKKPSGLTEQRFEKTKKPIEVSPKTIKNIDKKLELEFKDLTDKIVKESPIKETYENLKSDVKFKKNSSEAFEKVTQLAESYPNKFKSELLKDNLSNLAISKKGKGITPTEFDKKYESFIEDFIKDTKKSEFNTSDLVTQYRKNNKSLGQAYEPGQSFAHNNAKREALIDYNKAIAEIIETQHPNSEFSKLFKETNKRWADISDAEAIDKFIDKLFKGEIQYQKGRQFFDKQGMSVPFKRAMGNEGFAKFETLMSDLMTTEQARKLISQAKEKGFTELASTGLSYLIHPSIAGYKIGYDLTKGLYKKSFEALLDKPQLAVTWDRGVNAMKKGNFKAAEQEFLKLQTQINPKKEEAKLKAIERFKSTNLKK